MEEASKPDWDDELAAALVGKTVLVGITFVDGAAPLTRQMFGTVTSADRDDGLIHLRLAGSREGEVFTLPPDPGAFRLASPGRYTLRGTGEEVVDPDYLCTWEVHGPGKG